MSTKINYANSQDFDQEIKNLEAILYGKGGDLEAFKDLKDIECYCESAE